VSDDGGEDIEFEQMLGEVAEDFVEELEEVNSNSSDEDLNDFTALKSKTEQKMAKRVRDMHNTTGAVTIANT